MLFWNINPACRGIFYMSNVSDLDLNLENLFQPAWAQGKTESNKFEKFTGNEGVKPERSFSGKPGERRAPRRDGAGGGGGGGERPAALAARARGGSKFGGGDRKGAVSVAATGAMIAARERPAPPAPLPELNVAFIPEERGVEQLARQIKMTGRAYPLFQIALLILQKAERYSVQLTVKKKADGTVAQPLFVCALDDTPWTSEDEAVAHVLKNHFATFYQAERTATEPPKGVYTFVAQCGMSGVILGPPNHHDYQNQLRKLHAEKFSRMPFDMFKARVKIVKDEAVVKKWIEEQSFKTEYVCLNVPEPLKLATLEEVEKHFRATHKDSIIKPVETLTVAGVPSRSLRSTRIAAAHPPGMGASEIFPAAHRDEAEPGLHHARRPSSSAPFRSCCPAATSSAARRPAPARPPRSPCPSLQARPARPGPRALILEPTRELAAQVETAIRDYARFTDLKVTVVLAASATASRTTNLRAGADIVVATPGRLLDHLEQGTCGSTRWNFSCSTKPTGCSTWVFCPTCAASWKNARAAPHRAVFRHHSAADRNAHPMGDAQSGDD
jgi:hypothetical protein